MVRSHDKEVRLGGMGSLVLLLLMSQPGMAAEYFVSPDGDDWNSGTSISEPWRSIAKANGALRAGDTVFLRGGEYVDDPIEPARSGQPGQPIIYSGYQGERAVITSHTVVGLNEAIALRDIAHIVIEKLVFTGRQPSPNATLKHFATFDNASYIEIRDCEFEYAEGWAGMNLVGGSHHNKLLRNRIDFVGAYDQAGDDYGDGIWVADSSHHNLIASNYITHGGHDLLRTKGYRNIVQDNTFDNDWSDVAGPGLGGRNLTLDGTENVFQRNIVRNAARSTDAPKNSGMKVEGRGNIVRRNLLVDNHHDAIQTETGSWQQYAQNARIYHNTIYNNGGAAWRVRFYETTNWPTGNVFKNNLVFGNRQDPPNDGEDADFRIILSNSGVNAPGGNEIVNNLVVKAATGDARIYMTPPFALVLLDNAESTYGDLIANNIQEPPVFAKQQRFVLNDYELAAGSRGHDEAAPLTFTASSGFGSRIRVEDASYFTDGYGLAPGDVLRIGFEEDVRVLEVDQRANELTVDREIGWTEGDAVMLEYDGAAPDIGAVEAGQTTQFALKPKAPLLIATPIPN